MRFGNRRLFLGSGAALALVGSPLLSEFARAAAGADPADLATLNTALELERAGIKAYDDAAATRLLAPAILDVAKGFRADHVAHLDALTVAVRTGGGTPSLATAKLDYPALRTSGDILRFARDVEEKAASTYLSVIPDLKDRTLAQTAAAILGVETTHVALLAQALGERAYPHAFTT